MKTLRFLIVEDHQFQRQMLEQALLSLGAGTVHSAANGAEAMRVLRNPATPIDLVITDLMMPEVDGIELLPLLGKATRSVPVVLSSSDELSLLAAVEIAKGHGVPVLGAITKPITPAKLRPLIDGYLANRPATGA